MQGPPETPSPPSALYNRSGLRSEPRPTLEQPTFTAPQRLASANGVGGGPEPNILVTRDGRIYVTYLDNPIGLWRSDDSGATYKRLEGSALKGAADGATTEAGNGTLYWAGLGGSSSTALLTVGVQSSTDHGEHWSDHFELSDGQDGDRQWVDGFPNGTVMVSWTGFGGSDSLLVRTSPDGKRWLPIQTVVPSQAKVSGPLVHDPGNPTSLYIPYNSGNDLRVVFSHDGGKTWNSSTVAARLAKGFIGHGVGFVAVAAVDTAGTVYVAWSSPQHDAFHDVDNFASALGIYLSHSLNGGKTWSPPRLVSTPGHVALFPWVSAGAPGRIVLTWYENQNGINQMGPDLWDAILMESVTADLDNATFLGGRLNQEPVHVGQICDLGLPCTAGDRSRGDFFSNAIKPDGQPVVAWVSDSQVPGSADVMVGGVATGTPLR